MTGAAGPPEASDAPAPDRARRARRLWTIAAVAVTVIAVDQVTKSLAVAHLSDHSIHLVGPFWLELAYNTGVAFSLGTGLTLPIIIVAVVLVAVVAWFGRTVPNLAAAVGVGMILGGAISNLADRLFRGHDGGVVDFLRSGFWPTFNVADACIVCGSVVLGIGLWRAAPERSAANGAASGAPGASGSGT